MEFEYKDITEEDIKEYDSFENYNMEISTIVAYLLGVRMEVLFGEDSRFKKELIKELDNNKKAKMIRSLSTLRDNILHYTREINIRRENLIPLEQMEDIISVESIKYLRNNNIEIIHVGLDMNSHLAFINQHILDNIDSCKELIPSWIKWDYIKSLFLMPKCYAGKNGNLIANKEQRKKVISYINDERKIIHDNIGFYPWQTYIHWNPNKMMDYYGNLLFNDSKLLTLLYSSFGDTFKASEYVIDATKDDKDNIYDFIFESENVAVLVDCENVDPYRFVSVFKGLDENSIKKIKKVILYDDVNTSSAWDHINKIIDLPVEHQEVTRVLENKSLVDIAMTAGACKEFYQENTESLVLASSDSDFWGLIKSLPIARYFVLNESDKTALKILEELDNNGIKHCFMDSFAQANVQDFKNNVLLLNLKKKIEEFNKTGTFEIMNPIELVNKLFEEAYVVGSQSQLKNEKEAFYDKYIKKGFKISVIEDNGEYRFEMELAYK